MYRRAALGVPECRSEFFPHAVFSFTGHRDRDVHGAELEGCGQLVPTFQAVLILFHVEILIHLSYNVQMQEDVNRYTYF